MEVCVKVGTARAMFIHQPNKLLDETGVVVTVMMMVMMGMNNHHNLRLRRVR